MFGAKRVLTSETVKASRNKAFFDNSKFRDQFKVDFQPIKPVILKTAGFFILDIREGWLDKSCNRWQKPA
jgi:hypothetical protein